MSDAVDIRRDVNRGLAWIGLASSWVSVLDVVANVLILAYWVSPSQYGVAALAITLFPVLDLAADMGLSAAVVQRDDHTDDKISTVFWLNLAMSIGLFGAIALVAGPALSALHGEPVVGLMLTAYGTKLIWQNIYQVPKALMRRELRFKEVAGVRAAANVLEFATKIGFAASGAGIWCFVLGPLARELGWGVGIQVCEPWRPRFVLRVRAARAWIAFGVKTSASQIVFHLYSNIDYQIVGYYFGSTANGLYRLAYDIVLEPCRMLSLIVSQVAFPTYARLKARRAELVAQLIAFTRLNLVVILGFLAVVVVCAADIIGVLWGGRWLPAVTAVRVLAVVGVLRALSFLLPPLLEGIGHPGRSLAYNLVAAIVLSTAFVASAALLGPRFDFLSVAIAWAVGYPIAFGVLVALTLAAVDLRASEYARAIAGIGGCALLAAIAGVTVQLATAALAPSLRLPLTVATIILAFGLALARWQDISPRTVARALRG